MNYGLFMLQGTDFSLVNRCVGQGFEGQSIPEFRPILCITPGAVFLFLSGAARDIWL
jgi:hypothetical protein